jgi:uncharacterized Zn finger protein
MTADATCPSCGEFSREIADLIERVERHGATGVLMAGDNLMVRCPHCKTKFAIPLATVAKPKPPEPPPLLR